MSNRSEGSLFLSSFSASSGHCRSTIRIYIGNLPQLHLVDLTFFFSFLQTTEKSFYHFVRVIFSRLEPLLATRIPAEVYDALDLSCLAEMVCIKRHDAWKVASPFSLSRRKLWDAKWIFVTSLFCILRIICVQIRHNFLAVCLISPNDFLLSV